MLENKRNKKRFLGVSFFVKKRQILQNVVVFVVCKEEQAKEDENAYRA